MNLHCQSVLLRLDDMGDIALIIDGKFRMRSIGFDLHHTFDHIKKMMEFKANIKNIDLSMETFSDESATLV